MTRSGTMTPSGNCGTPSGLNPKLVKANYQLGSAAGAHGTEGRSGPAARAGEVAARGGRSHARGCSSGCWILANDAGRSCASVCSRRALPPRAAQRSSAADGRTGPAVRPAQPTSASSRRPTQRNPDDPKGLGAARSGLPGSQRRSARARSVSARREGRTRSPLRRTTGSVSRWRRSRICRRHRRIQEGRRAGSRKYGRAYSNLGSTLAQSGDYAEAVQVFRQALALEPNSVGAHLNLGTALRETGDLDGALEHLRKVADADPNNASVQYELGQTLGQSGNAPGAIAAFERALEINPEMREAYYALGNALKQQSRESRKATCRPRAPADDLYKPRAGALGQGDLARRPRAARRGPASRREVTPRRTRCSASRSASRATCRRPSLTSSGRSRCDPDSSEAHYNLGVALWYSGEKDRAVTELRESVKLDPAAGASHAFLGTVLRERGDLAGARASLQRAIALLPSSAAVYVDLGITYLRAGQLDQGAGAARGRAERPVAVAARRRIGARAIAALREALSALRASCRAADGTADRQRAEAHNTARPAARPRWRERATTSRRVPRSDSPPSRLRRGVRTISASC